MSFEDSKDAKLDAPDAFAPEEHVSQLAETMVLTRREKLSSAFTIACSGFALISDGEFLPVSSCTCAKPASQDSKTTSCVRVHGLNGDCS